MGVAISALIESKETTINQLSGKTIAIDAMNMLYQFVTTIRQQDGTPLKDSKGNVTSHLTGLFARCTKLMEKNIKLVFVFDGEMPPLKKAERERRDNLKAKALASYKEAEEAKDIEGMKKFAGRTARITKDMLRESKELLDALGIPVVQAPSEGEAQAAFMVAQGDCDFVGSQDFDCLIYGAPKMIKNLSISQKRKKINALTYKSVVPEILDLSFVLQSLDLTLDQLRALAIIIGTDFNIGGIKGLGPKKGLALVKEYKEDFTKLFEHAKFSDFFDIPWEDVFSTIKNMPTTTDYKLEWNEMNEEKLIALLVDKHDFSRERITNKFEEIQKAKNQSQQTSLGTYFG